MNIRVFYLRDINKFPVAAVATKIEGDYLRFAVATHNPLDRYDKNYGKALAVGRLFSSESFLLPLEPGVKQRMMEAILSLYDCESKQPFFPQRTREAAALWLVKKLEEDYGDIDCHSMRYAA